MTKDEILSMGPGIEMDELVGIHVKGARKVPKDHAWGLQWEIGGDLYLHIPSYSTDTSAAMEVANWFWSFKLVKMNGGNSWTFELIERDNETKVRVEAQTAQEAICKCALIAVLDF